MLYDMILAPWHSIIGAWFILIPTPLFCKLPLPLQWNSKGFRAVFVSYLGSVAIFVSFLGSRADFVCCLDTVISDEMNMYF